MSNIRTLGGIAFANCLVSITGSLFLLSSWHKLRKRNKNKLLNDYVAYMSICDLFFNVFGVIFYSNPAFDTKFISKLDEKNHSFCSFLGGIYQLILISTTTFSFMISAFILLPLARDPCERMENIQLQKKYHLFFGLCVVLVVVLIPAFSDKYGLTLDPKNHPFMCWIADESYYISIYIPVIIYIVFAFAVTLYCAWRSFKDRAYDILREFRCQVIWYCVAFIVIFFVNVIGMFILWFEYKPTSIVPLFIILVVPYSAGWVNALIWYRYNTGTMEIGEELSQSSVACEFEAVKSGNNTLDDASPATSLMSAN